MCFTQMLYDELSKSTLVLTKTKKKKNITQLHDNFRALG